MPFDLSLQQCAVVVCAFLFGALLDAVVSGFLLFRAENRNKQLRRYIARLTADYGPYEAEESVADSLLRPDVTEQYPPVANPPVGQQTQTRGHPGTRAMPRTIPPRQEPEPPAPTPAPDEPRSTQTAATSGPVAWEPAEDAEAFAEIPFRQPSNADSQPAAPLPEVPEPAPASEPVPRPQPDGASSSFATTEAEKKFYREYRAPMEDARNAIAELRSRISGDFSKN